MDRSPVLVGERRPDEAVRAGSAQHQVLLDNDRSPRFLEPGQVEVQVNRRYVESVGAARGRKADKARDCQDGPDFHRGSIMVILLQYRHAGGFAL
jgi:hypothetical protein